MSKANSKLRKRAYGVILILLAVLFVSSALLLINYWEKGQGLFLGQNSETNPVFAVDGVEYSLNKDVNTVLLIGLDKFDEATDSSGYYNDMQADFLMLFAIDNKNQTYSAVELNRDTMAQINVLGVAGEKLDTITAQLALAHTYGNGKEVSCRNTADAVSDLLNNLSIDRYVSVTMDAVPVISDLVGGVEVEVKDDFSGVDETLVMGETVLLKGEHALNYVRTRYGLEDSSNSTRMSRQREYMSSLFKTFNEKIKSDDSFILNASSQLSDYIVSNYTIKQLENLLTNIKNYEFQGIYSIDGDYKVGEKFMEFYPYEDEINRVLIDLFYLPKV